MKDELQRAKAELIGQRTCVAVCDGAVVCSEASGIAPMLRWISEGRNLRGAVVADRIVGKAAAMLFAYAKVRAVYAEVLSEAGYRYLTEQGVAVEYVQKTTHIINRAGTGICPMEEEVLTTEDCARGYEILCAKVKAMQNVG